MPFITEELYHRLPGADIVGAGGRNECGSIAVAAYPAPPMTQPFFDEKLDSTMALLNDISHSARSTRASLQLTKQRLTMYIMCGSEEVYQTVKDNAKDIAVMSNAAAAHALKASVDTTHKSCAIAIPKTAVTFLSLLLMILAL